MADPLCCQCQRPGVDCDHKTPHRGDEKLFFDYANTQTLCKACHGKKSAKE